MNQLQARDVPCIAAAESRNRLAAVHAAPCRSACAVLGAPELPLILWCKWQ